MTSNSRSERACEEYEGKISISRGNMPKSKSFAIEHSSQNKNK